MWIYLCFTKTRKKAQCLFCAVNELAGLRWHAGRTSRVATMRQRGLKIALTNLQHQANLAWCKYLFYKYKVGVGDLVTEDTQKLFSFPKLAFLLMTGFVWKGESRLAEPGLIKIAMTRLEPLQSNYTVLPCLGDLLLFVCLFLCTGVNIKNNISFIPTYFCPIKIYLSKIKYFLDTHFRKSVHIRYWVDHGPLLLQSVDWRTDTDFMWYSHTTLRDVRHFCIQVNLKCC